MQKESKKGRFNRLVARIRQAMDKVKKYVTENKKKPQTVTKKGIKKSWRRPIFAYTIVGAEELNFCVRDGNRCTLFAIVTKKIYFRK